jgi:hypothetical protein
MQVYRAAVEAGSKKQYSPALARLKALLLDQPVTVAIDESTVPEDAKELADALPTALKIWQGALSDSPFQEAPLSKKPQVVIRFVSSLKDLPQAQGDVQAQRDFYWGRKDHGYKLTATIRVMYRTGRRFLDLDEASGVVAHELGHLLGLDDVETREGLMGYFVAGRPKTRVEPEEVVAVGNFRQMIKDQIATIEKNASVAEKDDSSPLLAGVMQSSEKAACRHHKTH